MNSPGPKLVSYGVLVVLPEPIQCLALELNQVLTHGFESTITLDSSVKLPHLTLHQVAMPDVDFVRWIAALNFISTSVKRLDVTLHSCRAWTNGGIWWHATPASDALWRTHARIVGVTDEFRSHYVLPHLAPLAGELNALTWQERRSMALHGQPWANTDNHLAPYSPHITVGRVAHDQASLAVARMDTMLGTHPKQFSSQLVRVVELGQDGTCGKTVADFPLGV